ncbi:MAG: cytochrome P450 [Polaromonas sp.]|nr:cytochrome P450 [Polaromonas sp.]
MDAVEAVTHADPYPYYKSLRQGPALHEDSRLGLWVASRQSVIAEAFAHPLLFVRPAAEPVPAALVGTPAGDVFGQLVRMTDGAFHAMHKPAVEQAAQRWTLKDVAQAARDATETLQPVLGANDLISTLPVQAMARLLGVAEAALDSTCRQVRVFVQGIAPKASKQAVEAASGAAEALMAQGREEGLAPVQAANRIAFMQQSLDATAGLIGLAALMLKRDAALAAAADTSQEAMRAFVAEVERHQAPIQNTRRFAAVDLVLAGQPVAAGQGVLLVLASANRDEAFNPQADGFYPARNNSRSMGFGGGVHRCPGSKIAIEIVASCLGGVRANGRFDSYFPAQAGFRPLGNARIPVFEV